MRQKTEPFNSLEYLRVRNIPYLCWMALEDAVKGEFRYAAHMLKTAAMVLLLALGLIALSGCATTRYVTVYCVSRDQALPAEPPKVHDKLTGQADRDVGILGGSAIRLRAWGQGLNNILEGCREPPH